MKKRKLYASLRLKLAIIAVILIAIPIVAISMTYTKTVKEIISKKYTDSAIQSVYEAGEQIDYILRDVEDFSTVIISNAELLEMAKNPGNYSKDQFNTLLRSLILSRDDIEVIDVVLPSGIYSMGANKVDSKSTIEKELMESSGQPVWLETQNHVIEILSGRFHKNYFALGRKIINYNTLEDLGYLVINLEEVMLEQSYKSLLDNES